jgi:hypothetical protein
MRLLLTFLTALGVCWPQAQTMTQGAYRMEITLERREGSSWKSVDPRTVLLKNDRVRFRFRTNFSGYLYVTNRSTSGTDTLLFPRSDTGSQNRIAASKEYLVPATHGAFRVDGPEGYDVVSWLVSPVALGTPEKPSTPPAPVHMTPRCDDTIFKSRGDCVDTAAGPKSKKDDESSEGLVFIREKNSSIVSSPKPLKAPVVYEFHLAHK